MKLRQETREVDSWSGVPTWNKPPLNIDLAWLPAGEGRLGRFMFCDITMAVIVNTEADTFHGYNRYYMVIWIINMNTRHIMFVHFVAFIAIAMR